MANWLPALKAVLPYITNVVTAALPAFSARPGQDVTRQIAELQTAVTHNAESIRVLAEQMQRAIRALEEGATNLDRTLAQSREALGRHESAAASLEQQSAALEQRLRTARRLALAAVVIAAGALVLAIRAL